MLVLGLQACAAETMEPGPLAGAGGGGTGPSYAMTVQPLFDSACNCHQSTPFLMAPFSLKPEDAYRNLVNVPASQLMTMAFVKPGVLNESYLWHKVNGTQLVVGGSGKIMPSTIPLDAAQLATIERWIAGGAAP